MTRLRVFQLVVCLAAAVFATGCETGVKAKNSDPGGTGMVPAQVQPDMDTNNFKVDHPDQFPLVAAGEHVAAPELNVTGVVSPDVSRQVPVPSLATGRIVEIDARLGDEVKKGQLLFKVRSTDMSGAYSNYRQAVKNEELTKIQLEPRQHPARAWGDSQERARKSPRTPRTTTWSFSRPPRNTSKLLGVDPDHPTSIV